MYRDFKGVWIPKEIWLNDKLSLLEKVLLVEISSLDNEEHCIASNEYLASFCGCSESSVTKAIKKLKKLELLEEIAFDGRIRKLRVVNFTSLPSKFYEHNNIAINNINSITNTEVLDNTINNKSNNKLLEQKKKNRYEQCYEEIEKFTDNVKLQALLDIYLRMRLEIKDKPLYKNTWKGLLNKLNRLSDNTKEQIEIVQQSLDRGYASFYKLKHYNKTTSNELWNKNVKSESYTKEELEELERQEREMNARGRKTRF